MGKHHIAYDVDLKHPKLSCTSKHVPFTVHCCTGTTQYSTPARSDVDVAHGPDVKQLGCWPARSAAHVGAPCRECSTLQAIGTKGWRLLSKSHEPGTGKLLDQCSP